MEYVNPRMFRICARVPLRAAGALPKQPGGLPLPVEPPPPGGVLYCTILYCGRAICCTRVTALDWIYNSHPDDNLLFTQPFALSLSPSVQNVHPSPFLLAIRVCVQGAGQHAVLPLVRGGAGDQPPPPHRRPLCGGLPQGELSGQVTPHCVTTT